MNKIVVNEVFTEDDIINMNAWVRTYAGTEHSSCSNRVPFEEVLDGPHSWSTAKYNLYKIFGEKLCLTKSVSYSVPINQIMDEIVNSEAFQAFCDEVANVQATDSCTVIDKCGRRRTTLEMVQRVVLSETYSIATNNWEFHDALELPIPGDSHPVKIQYGTKVLRALGKIAAAYNLTTFENFRLFHSQVLNRAKMTGKLCLSIHPMDYMTMSDNDYNWSSCMSWRNHGCYRRGTVEMMNSSYVVVAYLAGEGSVLTVPCGTNWNNKKWRTLILLTPQAIASVKAYPYESDDLTKSAVTWLAELANAAGADYDIAGLDKYEYEDEEFFRPNNNETGIPLCFYTETMYNDFGTGVYHWLILNSYYKNNIHGVNTCYSGYEQCVWCGKYDFYSSALDETIPAESLVCACCGAPNARCTECGNLVHEEELISVDDSLVCSYCYEHHCVEDVLTGERHSYVNMIPIHLVPNDTYYWDSNYFYPVVYVQQADNSPEWLKRFPPIRRLVRGYWYRERFAINISLCSEEALKRLTELTGPCDFEYIKSYTASNGGETITID